MTFILVEINFSNIIHKINMNSEKELVLVTGAANGIGRHIVLEVAKLKRFNIAAWDIDPVRTCSLQFNSS